MKPSEKIQHLLKRNVEEVIEKPHLEAALKSGKKLRVKLGIDPTSPDLHLGHAVVLGKLREFQNLGHKAILIIGDFTARVGDPSGRSKERRPLTAEEIQNNMKTYLKQAGKIVDIKKAEIRWNSEWFDKEGVEKLIEISSAGSIQQVLRRADFKKRLDAGGDLTLLELLYPLLQGYDSVKVKADVELGGTDQKFNLLMGRRVQRHFGVPQQDVLMTPLLEGTDGVRKMSKSYGNYVGLTDNPEIMFGKIMAVPDKQVVNYFAIATDLDEKEIKKHEQGLIDGKNPKFVKEGLAYEIVKRYHGEKAARGAQKNFERLFSKKDIFNSKLSVLKLPVKKMTALDLVLGSRVAKSKSEARRLIEQGGFELGGKRISDPAEKIQIKGGETVKIGKKNFLRLRIQQ